jgi:hypothetical protein
MNQGIVSQMYEAYRDKDKKPRLHPVAQALGDEWRRAGQLGREGEWDNINVPYVEQLCKNARGSNPDWHADLSMLDLSKYINGTAQEQMWWVPQASTNAEEPDGASDM